MNEVYEVLRSEAILLGLYFLTVILFGVYWAYIMRRWTWIPRRKQRRGFGERFYD